MQFQKGIIVSALSGPCGDTVFATLPKSKGGGIDLWPRKRGQKRPLDTAGYSGLARAAFSYADRAYSCLPASKREEWRAAVKAPRTTAYTLFMKEAMASIIRGGRVPKHPSESGGFSTRYLPMWEDATLLSYECAEMPRIGKIGSCWLSEMWFVPPGRWNLPVLDGALRTATQGDPWGNWGAGGIADGITVSVIPEGHPELAANVPCFRPGGWPSYDDALNGTLNFACPFDVPEGCPSVTVSLTMPQHHLVDGVIMVAVVPRSPGLPLS